jgi:riboflavin synthase
MFTGIVETLGSTLPLSSPPSLPPTNTPTTAVTELLPQDATSGGGTTMTISDCASILSDCVLGDSISVNGTCLTVTEFTSSSFKIGAAPETLRRTNLGSLTQGSKVNLERAVSAHTRMGGHFVQGHVDTIAEIVKVTPDNEAKVFRMKPRDASVLRYIVEKGYVTLDGASLTITAVDDEAAWFEIMMIDYTQTKVVMGNKKEGDTVNVEVDCVGKYVEKSVVGYFEGSGRGGEPAILEKIVSRIVDEKLAKQKS